MAARRQTQGESIPQAVATDSLHLHAQGNLQNLATWQKILVLASTYRTVDQSPKPIREKVRKTACFVKKSGLA
jgi:hypothetical protein